LTTINWLPDYFVYYLSIPAPIFQSPLPLLPLVNVQSPLAASYVLFAALTWSSLRSVQIAGVCMISSAFIA